MNPLDVPALPHNAVLLHIGPMKTGSSAIQSSLHHARPRLRELGVVYPGTGTRDRRAGWFVLGTLPRGRPKPEERHWQRLVDEVAAHPHQRVCISNEDYGRAWAKRAGRVVAGLGGPDRVHVLSGLRRLDRIIPSMWQERVKNYGTITYADYLGDVLQGPTADVARVGGPAQSFWMQQDLAAVVRRWTAHLPPDQLTFLVSDEQDRQLQHRVFERLLGLPVDTIELSPRANASLTANGAEALRRLNEVHESSDWPDELYHHAIQFGLTMGLQRGPRGDVDQRIPPMPGWAAERLAELDDARLATLADSGARVLGDPEMLRSHVSAEADVSLDPPEVMSLDLAVAALEWGVVGAERYHRAKEQERVHTDVDDMRAVELLRVVARRAVSRLRRRRTPG